MSRHTHTRRSVLNSLGIATTGLVAFSGTAAADSETNDCEKTERHTIRVEVVDRLTGEPLEEYAITLNGGLFTDEDQFSESDEEGVLYLHLPDGEYSIRAAAYPEYMHGFEDIVVDGEDSCVTIEVPPGPQYDHDSVDDDTETSSTSMRMVEAE